MSKAPRRSSSRKEPNNVKAATSGHVHRILGWDVRLAGIFALALLIRLAGIGWGLPSTLEEAYPLKVAWVMSGLSGTAPFTLNPHFFRYPSLYIYVNLALLEVVRLGLGTAAEVRALYLSDPTIFYLTARGLTALLGALIVVPVYTLGLRAGGRMVAAVAALIVAANPALVAKSQMVDVDIPMALLVTCALAIAVSMVYSEHPLRRRSALAAGAVVGLAASVKYPGGLAIVSVLVALAIRAGSARRFSLLATLACLAAVSAFAMTSPFVLLDLKSAARDMAAERMHLQLGHFGSETGAAWSYYFSAWFKSLLGWIPGALALLGMAFFALKRRVSWAVLGAVLVASFWLAVSGWTLKADRYLLPVVPCATVFAAAFAIAALLRIPKTSHAAIVGGLAAVLCVVTDIPRWQVLAARATVDTSQQARTWIETNLPSGSMVVTEPYAPDLPSPLTAPSAEDLRREREGAPARRYFLVPIPMFQVEPERSSVYYDPQLCEAADAWVTTGAVRSRYQSEPDRFPNQNAFYHWLNDNWVPSARFEPGNAGGSEILIYRNPHWSTPFTQRVTPPLPPTQMMREVGGIGGESTFYFNLGGNYYAFGHPAEAATCFRIALAFPTISGGATSERIRDALQLCLQDSSGRR